MAFDSQVSGAQTSRYKDWHIIYSPSLSLDWLHSLLELYLPDLNDDDESVLKLDDSSLVLKKDSDIGYLVATLYKRTSFRNVIRNTLSQTYAQHCWHFAHKLRSLGLGTPEPLAYIEEKKVGFNYRSWYICRYDEGISCANYFLHSASFTPAMANTAAAIVDMFIELKNNQMSHGNIKANNLLISVNRLSLIDLHCMDYQPDSQKAEQMWRQDIGRFMENWRERFDIEKQFRLAFSKRGVLV